MELIIAESGNTKTDWIFHRKDGIRIQWQSDGLNPAYMDDAQLIEGLRFSLNNQDVEHVTSCFFYGAGVGTTENRYRIARLLRQFFPESSIQVFTDLQGAVHATCGDAEGIVAILGTGSNAALWNGREISSQAGGHGYLLGDEGSGSDIGKTLIQKALNNELSPEIIELIEIWSLKSLPEIKREVYATSYPGRFLAGFSKFAGAHQDNIEIRTLIEERVDLFIRRCIIPLHAPRLPVHCCGSVGYAFATIWQERLQVAGLVKGNMIQHPALKLLEYHLTHNLS